MSPDRDTLARWVAAYDAQGWHRSGSAADRRSGRWLAEEAAALGATPRTERFSFPRLVVRRAEVSADGVRLPAAPLHDSLLPAGGEVTGVLGPAGSSAALAVTTSGPTPSDDDALSLARRSGQHLAVIAVSQGGGLALRNSESVEPFGVPVVQIAGRFEGLLRRWADSGVAATVMVDARRSSAAAVNVIASIEGTHRLEPPLIVLTPRSGWWHCAAERGGGLACWLAALGETASRPPRRTVHYVATSGHELAYAGFHAFLEAHGLDRSAMWVHLGANIGALGGTLGVASSDRDMAEHLLSLISQRPGDTGSRLLAAPVGEGGELHRFGAQVVSLVGTNERFHQRSDRYPDNVDLTAVHRVASVVAALVRDLGARA